MQFQSGRRRYLCRAFLLEDHWNGMTRETRIALLFERGPAGPAGNAKAHRKPAGMREDAFSFAPDPRFFYLSRGHQEVFASIRNLVRERRGIGVVLAQAGMGKTALLEYLAESLRPESEIGMLPGSFDTRGDLVRGVMGIFGANGHGNGLEENLEYFERWLASKQASGRLVTLLCDNAQELSADALENLCLFSELQSGPHPLLQVVLAGRQGLLEKLNDGRLAGASNAINVYGRLAPMDEAEVRGYVLHRLRIAGCTRQMFTSAALSSIALYSRGVPLNVNMICRHSLSLAATINLQTVDDRIVADSAYDLVLRAQPTTHWEDSLGGGSEPNQKHGLVRDRRGLRLVEKTSS